MAEVAFVPAISPNPLKIIWFCCLFAYAQTFGFRQRCSSTADMQELIWQFGCILCYLGITVIHHTGHGTKQQQTQMHHDEMCYLWFAYKHKSAPQPALPSTQNSFTWMESASDHSQKIWLLPGRSRDKEHPYQKYRDTVQRQIGTQPARILTQITQTSKFTKLSFVVIVFFIFYIRNLQ